LNRGCQIFLVQKNKIGEKCTKIATSIPECHRIYQNAIEYTKIAIKIPNGHEAHQKLPSQCLPKCTKIGIFGLKIHIPSGNLCVNERNWLETLKVSLRRFFSFCLLLSLSWLECWPARILRFSLLIFSPLSIPKCSVGGSMLCSLFSASFAHFRHWHFSRNRMLWSFFCYLNSKNLIIIGIFYPIYVAKIF
jgi:hypothetical protein